MIATEELTYKESKIRSAVAYLWDERDEERFRLWTEHELEWVDFVEIDTDHLWVEFYGSTAPRTCKFMNPHRQMGRCIIQDSLHSDSRTGCHISKPDHYSPHRNPNWWWLR